jgi:outer membrane protein assembly factor BamB
MMSSRRLIIGVLLAMAVLSPSVMAKSVFQERWHVDYNASFFGLPVFSSDLVFVCADAMVLAIDTQAGVLVWNASVETACQYITVDSANQIYVGSNNAITAFDAWTGFQVWEHRFVGSGTPARPTFAGGNYVAFTVENGGNSTPFTVLDSRNGNVAFATKTTLATSRIWNSDGKLLYVEAASATNATASLVARNASADFGVEWVVPATTSFAISSITAFVNAPVLVMLTPPNAIGVAVVSAATGAIKGTRLFPSATNNFDFTTGRSHFFTIESYGAPAFANSTISAFGLTDLSPAWAFNITAGAPNLVPASNTKESFIIAQASEQLLAFRENTGELAWNRTFANPQQVIGNGRSGEFVIGNVAEGRIYLFEF